MEIPPFGQKELALAVIEAELANWKLIFGLEQAGLVVGDFYTSLSISIFYLLHLPLYDDALFERYMMFIDQLRDFPSNQFPARRKQLAEELYEWLQNNGGEFGQ